MADNWSIRNEEFMTSDIQLAIKDGLPKPIRYELDDHPEEYRYLTYEDWCDLLSTTEVKYERKRSAVHIMNISSARSAYISNSDKSVRIPRKKKARTGVLRSKKSPTREHDRHHGVQSYCVIYKKEGMP